MDANSRIITLGDSVSWGQGLLPPHKFACLVANSIGASISGNGFILAHSGAIIGVSKPDPTSSINPEIPAPAPMIINQLSQVQAPDTVDLVLLTGGINDVNITTIFDPFTTLRYLHELTQQACYSDMKSLLAKVLSTFTKPTVQIRVVGYYPVVSPVSNPLPGPAGDPLVHLLGNFGLGFPQTLERNIVLGALSARAMQFWTDSNNFLQQAVDESSKGNAERLAFVKTPFTPDNALFTPNSFLWGFAQDLGPEDEVAAQREAACAVQYPPLTEFFANELCHLASIGHPNVAGAQAISQAILASLS
jgi:lysophospholipase L1-like esterase